MRPSLDVEQVIAAPSLEQAVQMIADCYAFPLHPYMRWMEDPATERDAFRRSQLPFRFTVEHFSRSLAAALARVPTVEARLPLAANVTEEHGAGSLSATHKHTFLTYLRALGATEDELLEPIPTRVALYSEFWLNYCLTHTSEEATACLGIVEFLYIGISGQIARAILAREWVQPGTQQHYEVHETLDVVHAGDLFALCQGAWSLGQRARVAQAMLFGAEVMWSIYDALLPTE